MMFLISGFFLPLWLVVLIYLSIELLLNYYNACPLTLVQERIDDDWDEGGEFIPHFFNKYFKNDLSDKHYVWFSYFMMTTPVYVAIIKEIFYK